MRGHYYVFLSMVPWIIRNDPIWSSVNQTWLHGREYQVATSSNFWKWWKIIAMIMIIIMIMIFEHNKRKNVPSYVTGYIWQGTPGCNFFQLFLTPSQPQLTPKTPVISWKQKTIKKKKERNSRLQLFSNFFFHLFSATTHTHNSWHPLENK